MTHENEAEADTAFLHLSKLRDSLVFANERVAAELVESAIQTLEDACRVLLKPADLGLVVKQEEWR